MLVDFALGAVADYAYRSIPHHCHAYHPRDSAGSTPAIDLPGGQPNDLTVERGRAPGERHEGRDVVRATTLGAAGKAALHWWRRIGRRRRGLRAPCTPRLLTVALGMADRLLPGASPWDGDPANVAETPPTGGPAVRCTCQWRCTTLRHASPARGQPQEYPCSSRPAGVRDPTGGAVVWMGATHTRAEAPVVPLSKVPSDVRFEPVVAGTSHARPRYCTSAHRAVRTGPSHRLHDLWASRSVHLARSTV